MQAKLLVLRKQNGWTQKFVADQLGITAESYGAKERGREQFKQDEMFKTAALFGKSISEVFEPREKEPV